MTFPARGQINNVFRITGKSGVNSIFFARPKTGERFRFYKEILTEVASIPIAFKTIVVMINLTLLCNFKTGWCKQFFKIGARNSLKLKELFPRGSVIPAFRHSKNLKKKKLMIITANSDRILNKRSELIFTFGTIDSKTILYWFFSHT